MNNSEKLINLSEFELYLPSIATFVFKHTCFETRKPLIKIQFLNICLWKWRREYQTKNISQFHVFREILDTNIQYDEDKNTM